MVMTLLTRPKKTVATVVVATDGSGDTTDIQTGIDLLPATGGVVYIKEGIYTITEEITTPNDNISIIGAGRSTEIRVDAPGPATQDGIRSTNDGIIIQNLYIIGVSNQGWGLNIRGDNCLIDHCWVTNMVHGIDLGGDHDTISNNFTYSNSHNGIFVVSTDRCIISNNQVYENVYSGIVLSNGNHNGVVSNNVVYHNDVNDTGSYDGIIVTFNCDNNVIVGNRCQDNNRYEINIVEAGCANNVIVGNNCVGTHTGAINDAGTGTIGLAPQNTNAV